jgi:hypothetical protein
MHQTVKETKQVNDRTETWRLFDLAHEQFKSISKAQYFYVSTLLIYLAIVWAWHLTGLSGTVPGQVLGITLSANGLWAITPGVSTALALGLIGSVNAAGPAWHRLRNIAHALDVHVVSGVALYDLDSHKNFLDYLTYLRLNPEGPVREQSGQRFSGLHFLYPLVFALSIYTSVRAIGELGGLGNLLGSPLLLVYACGCTALQIMYSIRPWYRASVRFWRGKLPED